VTKDGRFLVSKTPQKFSAAAPLTVVLNTDFATRPSSIAT
jgi:hypothetical protein